MGINRFDDLTRILSDGASRRDVWRGFVGTGAALLGARLETAGARHKHRQKHKHSHPRSPPAPPTSTCTPAAAARCVVMGVAARVAIVPPVRSAPVAPVARPSHWQKPVSWSVVTRAVPGSAGRSAPLAPAARWPAPVTVARSAWAMALAPRRATPQRRTAPPAAPASPQPKVLASVTRRVTAPLPRKCAPPRRSARLVILARKRCADPVPPAAPRIAAGHSAAFMDSS